MLPSALQTLLEHLNAYKEQEPAKTQSAALLRSISRIAESLNKDRRLRQIAARAAQIGGWELDLASDEIAWSEEISDIFGIGAGVHLTSEAAIPRFIHPLYQEQVRAALAACAQEGRCFDLELRARTTGGGEIWVRCVGQPVRDEAGSITGIEGAIRDITEQKHAENEINQCNERFRQLADFVPQPVWTASSDGVVDFVNKTAAESAGRAPEQLLGKKWLGLVHPQDLPQALAGWEKALQLGKCYSKELRLLAAGGTAHRWHVMMAKPVRDPAGKIVGWFGTASDIHDSKLAEADARRLAERLTTTLESITDAFLMLDREWRFTYLNGEAERLLQRRRAELLAKVIWDELADAAGTELYRQCHRAVSNSTAVEFEFFYPARELWLEVHAYPSEEGLAIYFKDITERRRLELFRDQQGEIMQQIAAGAALSQVLHAVVQLTEAQDPLAMCSVLLLDEDGLHLRLSAAPSLPEAYNRAIDGTLIGPCAGSCGAAAYERRPVIASDVATDPRWRNYTSLALAHGLRACWSVPIISGSGNALGAFAVYSRIPRTPKQAELDMLAWCAQTVSIALERQKTVQMLLENEKQSRQQVSLLDQSRDVIFVRDIEGRILFWNKGAERVYGWTKEEAVGRSLKELLQEDEDVFRQITTQVLQHDEWTGEKTVRHKDGRNVVLEARWTLVRDEDGKPHSILTIGTDITARKAAEREIHRLAFYDSLTRLPNRQLLLDRLKHALTTHAHSQQHGAVLFLDADKFKSLNETQGHEKGDLLLKQMAQRVLQCIPEHNTLARWGGDEFVVVMEELGSSASDAAAQAESLAERIREALCRPFALSGAAHRSSASIGVTLFSDGHESADELLRQAELAMYQAKEAGRNAVRFFDPAMQALVNERVDLEEDIRHGLQHDQFVLYYQPQLEGDGHVAGVEALVRWNHPKRGLVSPAEFIAVAEECGLIHELGQWVLETACAQLVLWAGRPETSGLTIAVNVSPRQFQKADFVGQVLDALGRHGADPRKLKIELTESLLISDMEQVTAKMHMLRASGIGLSLDDFGTGYSSLGYLKRLPLDQLKIDQSFVKDVMTNKDDASIVSTIIALGRTLGFKVIAEGVETKAHRDFLCHHGCDGFQGYLFSRPLPLHQLEIFLAEHANAAA